MILIISPAKKLSNLTNKNVSECSQAQFLPQSQQLVKKLKEYSVAELMNLMKISEKLAALNLQRFQDWKLPFKEDKAKPAILCFDGDVYTGLEASSLNKKQLQFTQKHIRILSGLYGLLRPLDLIMPYRLEMGSKVAIGKCKNLYDFWDNSITSNLNGLLNQNKNKVLINLASNEYFKSIKLNNFNHKIINPIFKDWKTNQYKIISFFAKKARGMMCRFAITANIDQPEGLKDFQSGGYKFCPKQSTNTNWVFLRK